MYSSKYSQVSKYSPEAQKRMQYRSKGKSCGYYMRIVFFFSSLIQSLIIISLVLFLIYGKKQDSASTTRIHDLEESFSRLSIENVALKLQRKNLTTYLNATVTEKARNDWDLARLREYTNVSVVLIQDMEKRIVQCNGELNLCKARALIDSNCPPTFNGRCDCGTQMDQLRYRLLESNFTQTVQTMRMDLEQVTKERDNLNLEAIRLRRDKSTHEKEVEILKKKCKEDFTESLSGVSRVTNAFLVKINSLFPTHIPFQLTCPKQMEHLEQIRTNCSSLSSEVEDRFQRYLNSVGDQVSNIQTESSKLKAENWRLFEDYRWCSQNRTGLIQQHKQSQDKLQLKHDQDKEKLLIDKMKLQGQIEVLENNVNYKTKEVEHLVEQMKHLNMTCMSRGGFNGGFGGVQQPRTGTGSSSSSYGQFNKPGSGSSSSSSSYGTYNKPASGGYGSSSSSSSSSGSSSSGYGSNKPASTGYGSSGSSYSSSGSSNSGYGSNKPASTGSGSSSSSLFSSSGSSNSGYGSNKPASTGSGSSLFSSGSSSSSGSSKPASSGSGSSLFSSGSSSSSGSSKPASSGSGSSLFSSGSSSSSGSSKPASSGSGSSLFSSGSSSSGYGSSKPASSGSGSSLFSSGSSSSSGSSKPASSGYGSSGSSSSSSSSSRASSSYGSSSSSSAKSPSSSGSSSSGSSGSASKSSSSSSGGWFNSWGSSSSSGQSKTGTGSSKPTSTGSGSSFGAGRTSGLVGGSVNIAQHLRDLQRLINPSAPEEKQDLSRMLG